MSIRNRKEEREVRKYACGDKERMHTMRAEIAHVPVDPASVIQQAYMQGCANDPKIN